MERHIDRLTFRDFAHLVPGQIDTVLLPVGTMEAHGCTNLGTDITIPQFISEKLAERMNFLIAPAVPYGITRTLLPYPGSMTVSPESFERYVGDVVISLFENGFKNVVIINGHGGHYDQLRNIAKLAWERTRGRTIVIHWWELCTPVTEDVFGQVGGHAGIDETAMVLVADPQLVKPEQCDDTRPFWVRAGMYAYPNPAPVLIYKQGEGAPKFDTEKANQYAEKVIDYIESFVREVISGWEKYSL